MSPSMTPQHSPHPEATLLPWFAAGTLSEAERQEVSRHVATCETCRTELEEIQRLRTAMKGAYSDSPQPSPAVWQRVRARTNPAAVAQRGPSPADSWLSRWWHRPWVPALATALIVAQFISMGWMIRHLSSAGVDLAGSQPGQITTRSIPPASFRITVRFLERATEHEIRSLLRDVQGRIVDGPLPGDAYVIEVPLAAGLTVEQTIQTLQTKAELVKSVERPTP